MRGNAAARSQVLAILAVGVVKMAVNVMQLSTAIKRMEEGAKQGRIIRLVAWQILYDDAVSLRADSRMRAQLIARLDKLTDSIEKVYG